MLKKFRALSLEKQLFISFLSLSSLLLLLSLSITLSVSLNRQRQEIDKKIESIAAYIASMDRVSSMLKEGYPDATAAAELDSLYETFSDIDVILICDADGLRFYHTKRARSGETFIGQDAAAILAGSGPYITTGYGTYGRQRQAFHAVRDQNTALVGFVMVSVFTTYAADQARALLPVYAFILFFMLLAGIFLSHGIVRLLQDSLMGHHPRELLNLYLQQDTVLNAMSEGLTAAGQDGNVIFVNRAARAVFSEALPAVGSPLLSLFPDSEVLTVLKTGTPITGRNCVLNGHSLIVSELPIGSPPAIQGTLTIFNDRSEIESVSDELSGARSMLDTLRAFNHEFLNKLHIILGYLQTGEIEKAITFITNSSLVSSEAIRKTADCLRVSRVCALVIGKMMHAAELGILLSVTPESRLHENELFLPVEPYVTIIGNLLENAIEELSESKKTVREITLGVYTDTDTAILTCEDTGEGIPAKLLPHIYEWGVSSKGENRGTGLYLIREALRQYGGEITIDTEDGEGTCFTLTFTRKEN
ncbi:MAG: GHKL domain-containing protein [Lachnospiraceae bacterium]|nr:GHKL domain-containing protein [Lachnospiraceae bacterium]